MKRLATSGEPVVKQKRFVDVGNGRADCPFPPMRRENMQLVEQHCIDKKDPRYAFIDEAAFKSKNLYNAALYEIRQAFIHQGVYLPYEEMDTRMKQHEAYKALPAKVSQQVLRLLEKNWKSFFEACQEYEQHP